MPSRRTRCVLFVSCAVAFALLVFRPGGPQWVFLLWNLFLAWLPYAFAVALGRRAARRGPNRLGKSVLAVAWLAFLPNAPYLVTDFVHLRRSAPAMRAYDAVMIGAFALAGLLLGFASLRIVQRGVAERFSPRFGWAFAVFALGLSGVGVWIGRFLRRNSWDLVVAPDAIVRPALAALADPEARLFAIGFSAAFGAFLVIGYLTYCALAEEARSAEGQASAR